MKNLSLFVLTIFLSLGLSSPLQAEQKTEAVASAPAATQKTPPAPRVESEKSKDWNGLQAQEQWVARLEKQIAGETRQLAEMRAKVAAKYKLDVKGFEAGIYDYDKEKDAFVER